MQLLGARPALARNGAVSRKPAPVAIRRVAAPARLIAGSRRSAVRVHAEAATGLSGAFEKAGTIAVRTIALRAAAAYKGTPVIVVGGTGQLSIRVVQELITSGFKVTAAVSDLDAANKAFDFFRRYEIIDKVAASNLKLVSVASLIEDEAAVKALPKRAKVVVVDGDQEAKARTGPKEVETAIAIANATSAAGIVLVSTTPGASAAVGGGGGFFGFFGAPKPAPVAASAKGVDRLGRTEQLVADCGTPYAIVRAYGTDRTADEAAPEYLKIGGLGSVPASLTTSKAQTAGVVGEVLKAASTPAELVVEVGATAEEQLSAADSVRELVAAAEAAAAEAAAAAAEEAAKKAAPAMGLFSLGFGGTAKAAAKEPAKKEVVEEPQIGTRSARRAAQARAVVVEELVVVEEVEAPKAGSGFFGFGTGKVAAKKEEPKKAAPKEEPKKEEAPKAGSGFFSFGTGRVAAKKAPEPEPEEEVEAPKAGSGFFSFGTGKVAAKKAPEPEPEEEVQAPKAGSGFFSFGTGKVAAKKEAPKKEEPKKEEAPKKKAGSGFFSFGAPVTVSDDDEEEVPAPRRGTSTTTVRKVAPAPAKAVPVKAAPAKPAPAPAKPAPAPPKPATTVVRKAAPPPPPPAPVKRAASPLPVAAKKAAPPPPPPAKKAAPPPPPPSRSTSSSRSAKPAAPEAPAYAPGTRGAKFAAQQASKTQSGTQRK